MQLLIGQRRLHFRQKWNKIRETRWGETIVNLRKVRKKSPTVRHREPWEGGRGGRGGAQPHRALYSFGGFVPFSEQREATEQGKSDMGFKGIRK